MEPDSAQMIDRAEEQLMTMEDDGGIWGAGEEQGGRDSRDSWDSSLNGPGNPSLDAAKATVEL
ncbi:hypothetical protein PAAG_00972 [Paracoccidioides lutzii Pb01]|uniref:Uncharacterized protein n=1 Tax=Paracoccidioides lutzii (strain ATCC MYA-826 / Pb01) TaxID=502779 RepID=C1GR27_PARBA|nr:hypothetical protein PAAG_00972 [Paracoccidioides lutzii Pb01]EEH38051.2 hypothetical protein PAAG_00972 [Paracoccidioides lutzii Pb01]